MLFAGHTRKSVADVSSMACFFNFELAEQDLRAPVTGVCAACTLPKANKQLFSSPTGANHQRECGHPVPAIILALYSVCLYARHGVYTPDNIGEIMDVHVMYVQNTAYTAVMSLCTEMC